MSWQLDSIHSHVGFSVKHMMVTTVRGRFKTYRGELTIRGVTRPVALDVEFPGPSKNRPSRTCVRRPVQGGGDSGARARGDLADEHELAKTTLRVEPW
jgi:polyisoprenoid-binding protein YceI